MYDVVLRLHVPEEATLISFPWLAVAKYPRDAELHARETIHAVISWLRKDKDSPYYQLQEKEYYQNLMPWCHVLRDESNESRNATLCSIIWHLRREEDYDVLIVVVWSHRSCSWLITQPRGGDADIGSKLRHGRAELFRHDRILFEGLFEDIERPNAFLIFGLREVFGWRIVVRECGIWFSFTGT